MTRSKRTTLLVRAAVVPLAALTFAGFGAGIGAAGASTAPEAAAKAKQATVRVAKTNLGKVLVNSKGRTLYMFGADMGTTSACTGACATNWPPLRVSGTPKAGKGAKADLLSTAPRPDAGTQAVYNGHLVYTFQADKKAGDTNGQGVNAFGGQWFALDSAGNQVTRQPSSSGASSSSGGTPGY